MPEKSSASWLNPIPTGKTIVTRERKFGLPRDNPDISLEVLEI
jgi:hypothetical protein